MAGVATGMTGALAGFGKLVTGTTLVDAMSGLTSLKKETTPTAKMTMIPIAIPIFFCNLSADSMVVIYYENLRGCRKDGSSGSPDCAGCVGRSDCGYCGGWIGCEYRGGCIDCSSRRD